MQNRIPNIVILAKQRHQISPPYEGENTKQCITQLYSFYNSPLWVVEDETWNRRNLDNLYHIC